MAGRPHQPLWCGGSADDMFHLIMVSIDVQANRQ